MLESLECLPCLSRQVAMTARLSTSSAAKQQAGLGEALMHMAIAEPSMPPPMVAEDLQRTLSRHTGSADPYAEVRYRLSVSARALLPALLRMKREADDPWEFSVRVAAAGNLLEAARDPDQAGPAMEVAWQATARGELVLNHCEALRAAAGHASHIVFLADNAGEVVWDRLLIDLLGAARVTLAVRGLPYLHNALAEDLDLSTWLVPPRVVTFDDPLPGYSTTSTAPALDQLLAKADLVIAKGSEWPERLGGRVPAEKCFYILAPACQRVARRFGVPVNSLVAAHGAAMLAAPLPNDFIL